MKRSKTESLTDILNDCLRQNGLETPLNQYRLIESWNTVVGKTIARYTGDLFIKNQTLYVKVKSSTLKSDLMMGRSSLVHQLNEHVGAYVISDIIFI